MEPKEEYDQFIVGVADTGRGPALIYDKDALLEYLAAQMSELAEDEYNAWDLAVEHFEYNIYGSTEYMGAGAPLFVSKADWEIAQEEWQIAQEDEEHAVAPQSADTETEKQDTEKQD